MVFSELFRFSLLLILILSVTEVCIFLLVSAVDHSAPNKSVNNSKLPVSNGFTHSINQAILKATLKLSNLNLKISTTLLRIRTRDLPYNILTFLPLRHGASLLGTYKRTDLKRITFRHCIWYIYWSQNSTSHIVLNFMKQYKIYMGSIGFCMVFAFYQQLFHWCVVAKRKEVLI